MIDRASASVIVVSYRGRHRIDGAIRALLDQDLAGPFEIIVVASGDDGCASHIRASYPDVRVVEIRQQLRPGPARNCGLDAATGEIIAFVPDDGLPHRDWLRRRLELHRAGADAVGGAIVNATHNSYIASAAHLLEYSALLPIDKVLRAQEIPHCLSFRREVFDLVGRYPENTLTGEDTVFNRACLEAGIAYAFSGDIRMGHVGLTSLRGNLRHAFGHGRGLMQCSERHGLGSVIGIPESLPSAAWRSLIVYPSTGLSIKARRFSTLAPPHLVRFLIASPVIGALLIATGLGALTEWHRSRTDLRGHGSVGDGSMTVRGHLARRVADPPDVEAVRGFRWRR